MLSLKDSKYFTTAFLTVMLLVCGSCEKAQKGNANRIRVNVVEGGTKAGGGPVTMTGESTTGTLKTNGFALDVYADDAYSDFSQKPKVDFSAGLYVDSEESANVTYSSSWKISGDPTWIANVNSLFWAHYPVSVKGNLVIHEVESPYNVLTFSYTMPTANGSADASSNFDDLVFAHKTQRFDGSNEYVNLEFHHALSQVRFWVDTKDGSPSKWDSGINIQKIEICGFKNKGQCTFRTDNTFAWTGQDGDYTFGQDMETNAPATWQTYIIGENDGQLCPNALKDNIRTLTGLSRPDIYVESAMSFTF